MEKGDKPKHQTPRGLTQLGKPGSIYVNRTTGPYQPGMYPMSEEENIVRIRAEMAEDLYGITLERMPKTFDELRETLENLGPPPALEKPKIDS